MCNSRIQNRNQMSARYPREEVLWLGKKECDFCRYNLSCASLVDGATEPTGRWGVMCITCYIRRGVGLGVGRGQFYRYDEQRQVHIKVEEMST